MAIPLPKPNVTKQRKQSETSTLATSLPSKLSVVKQRKQSDASTAAPLRSSKPIVANQRKLSDASTPTAPLPNVVKQRQQIVPSILTASLPSKPSVAKQRKQSEPSTLADPPNPSVTQRRQQSDHSRQPGPLKPNAGEQRQQSDHSRQTGPLKLIVTKQCQQSDHSKTAANPKSVISQSRSSSAVIPSSSTSEASTTSTLAIQASTIPDPEAEDIEPIMVLSSRDVNDIFSDMSSYFEGKESEKNWNHREKSLFKLRRLIRGNAPAEFHTAFISGFKGLLEGVLKAINSLRTTLSTMGCKFLQEFAAIAGHGLDSVVEILLQDLVKLCGGTKKLSAQNGNTTLIAIFTHVTYSPRLMQHIWNAAQDKNVQPRSFAALWVETLIKKYGHEKRVLEHGGSLDLIQKCVKRGLEDANPGVRNNARPVFWEFRKIWPDRAEL